VIATAVAKAGDKDEIRTLHFVVIKFLSRDNLWLIHQSKPFRPTYQSSIESVATFISTKIIDQK
jgi:hypothetical protein